MEKLSDVSHAGEDRLFIKCSEEVQGLEADQPSWATSSARGTPVAQSTQLNHLETTVDFIKLEASSASRSFEPAENENSGIADTDEGNM